MKSKREHRHSTVIYDHGTPVAFGFNTSDFHAEEEAISNLGMGYDCRSCVVVNVRITPGGRVGIAKPCLSCMELIFKRKFRKVVYSTNKGTFEEIWL